MFLTLPVEDIHVATPRARIVRISLQGHHFPYIAGQAALLGTPGHDRRRAYSIAGAPEAAAAEGALEFLIGVDPATGSPTHLVLAPGSNVDVEGPVGRFTFPADTDVRRFLFVAGGTGIAPLRAMLHHALRLRDVQIGVAYSARTGQDFAYLEELRALEGTGRITLSLTTTQEAPPTGWTGRGGRFTAAEIAPLLDHARTLCFVCGPQSMVKEMPALLVSQGVPREMVRIEEWG